MPPLIKPDAVTGKADGFVDLLGLTGPGVESLRRFWEWWAQQCVPPITSTALATGRGAMLQAFVDRVRRRQAEPNPAFMGLRADSAEEGAAFCAAAILAEPELAAKALVVTHVDGWRMIDQNPAVTLAIAAAPELAERPSRRPGPVVVIPLAGVMARQHAGAASADEVFLCRGRSHRRADLDRGTGLRQPRRSLGFTATMTA